MLHGTRDAGLLVAREGTETRSILAHEVAQVGKHLAGAVAAFHRSLVQILVKGIVGGAEQAAVDHVHIGIVAGIAQGVAMMKVEEITGERVELSK